MKNCQNSTIIGVQHEKTGLWGFTTNQVPNQSPQLDRLARKWKFACSKARYDTFQ